MRGCIHVQVCCFWLMQLTKQVFVMEDAVFVGGFLHEVMCAEVLHVWVLYILEYYYKPKVNCGLAISVCHVLSSI